MSPRCESEVVALVTGRVARRRAVLDWAADYVGRDGTVHVVCDGTLAPALVSSIMVGMFVDAEQVEHADFAQTAMLLAPHGCNWTWQHLPFGAIGHAVAFARRKSLLAVVPARSQFLRPPSVRIVCPR
ncbi:hypothetical protein [Nocardia nova]|uniref:hypothetical protein n=1 Tax=Nocardia nova TaxID=37330 RepID=UPI001893E118|nr:hypothetical protein [Nocardia nova]MBF6145977.1 hypothetical protein [Nocardia nova]MDN2501861.1 hypothetical protein [Nocardia nova]